MPVERMGVDVEEVFLRTMFGAAQVHSETRRSKGSELDGTCMITECGAGDMGKCGLVSKAWTKEYKAWLASEEKRVTEVLWERAVRDGVGLCCSMKYKLEECVAPDFAYVTHVLVFERQELIQVAGHHQRDIGDGVRQLVAHRTPASDRLHLFDQIEKKEQPDKAQQDKPDRPEHFGKNQAADGSHDRAPLALPRLSQRPVRQCQLL